MQQMSKERTVPYADTNIADRISPFSEWGTTFTDPRLAAAVLDRLTFNAHIIQTGTESYRLRTTRAAKKNAAHS